MRTLAVSLYFLVCATTSIFADDKDSGEDDKSLSRQKRQYGSFSGFGYGSGGYGMSSGGYGGYGGSAGYGSSYGSGGYGSSYGGNGGGYSQYDLDRQEAETRYQQNKIDAANRYKEEMYKNEQERVEAERQYQQAKFDASNGDVRQKRSLYDGDDDDDDDDDDDLVRRKRQTFSYSGAVADGGYTDYNQAADPNAQQYVAASYSTYPSQYGAGGYGAYGQSGYGAAYPSGYGTGYQSGYGSGYPGSYGFQNAYGYQPTGYQG